MHVTLLRGPDGVERRRVVHKLEVSRQAKHHFVAHWCEMEVVWSRGLRMCANVRVCVWCIVASALTGVWSYKSAVVAVLTRGFCSCSALRVTVMKASSLRTAPGALLTLLGFALPVAYATLSCIGDNGMQTGDCDCPCLSRYSMGEGRSEMTCRASQTRPFAVLASWSPKPPCNRCDVVTPTRYMCNFCYEQGNLWTGSS